MKPNFVFAQRGLALLSLSLLVACEQNPARLSGSSQATMVTDTAESGGGRTSPSSDTAGMPQGLTRVGDRVYYVVGGKGTLVTAPQRFPQGLNYLGANRVVTAAGETVRLNSGELVTLSGERIPLPPATQLP